MSDLILSARGLQVLIDRIKTFAPSFGKAAAQHINLAVDDILVSHRELDRRYRRALWFQHGCPPAGLYGDDGEMQCSGVMVDGKPRHRPLDFARDPILFLEDELGKMKLTESGIIFKGLNDEPIQAMIGPPCGCAHSCVHCWTVRRSSRQPSDPR